jgi:predicted Rossmann fold nucleotide-binding protein DprA/Smf involved in DNA uptake
MSNALSPNTKAILLLTGPLIANRSKKTTELLTAAEYKRLALRLRELSAEPADLVGPQANQLLADCSHVIDRTRIERLLGRGFLLSQAVERWHARALWVVSRADPAYPQRLKVRLGDDSPVLLYGCGEKKILIGGGLAVVGSRHVDDTLIEYTQETGRIVASAGRILVSGGARGIDQAAMRGALGAGGKVTGVLADSLERNAMRREHRNFLLEGQLVLISPYDPNAGFNVGHAMQRNKVIYALADAALIVSADFNRGGTWTGAVEQLEKLRLVPVFVRSTGEASHGLDALRKKGAQPWPNPKEADELDSVLAAPPSNHSSMPGQSQLSFGAHSEDTKSAPQTTAKISSGKPAAMKKHPITVPNLHAADELFRTVRTLILRVIREPKRAAEVAADLGVTQRQAEEWLKRLVDEGVVDKSKNPVRYSVRQSSLFAVREGGSGV